MYLLVTPAGGRLWRMKFRSPLGKERKLSFGGYPDVSLKEARRRRDAAREELAAGIDPAEQKREQARLAAIAANNSFNAVAEAYIAKNERDGLAENTIRKRRWFLALVAKTLGPRPISEIMPIDVLEAVRPFEKAKNDEKAQHTGLAAGFAIMAGLYIIAVMVLLIGRPAILRAVHGNAETGLHA